VFSKIKEKNNMEKLSLITVIIACLLVMVANYPDAVEGAHVLYADIFGEE
jgi:hypothetical protein